MYSFQKLTVGVIELFVLFASIRNQEAFMLNLSLKLAITLWKIGYLVHRCTVVKVPGTAGYI